MKNNVKLQLRIVFLTLSTNLFTNFGANLDEIQASVNNDLANSNISITITNSDGSITAGSGGEFTVSAAGALAATGATISGTIRASQGGFGTFSGATLTKGWTITSPSIVSNLKC